MRWIVQEGFDFYGQDVEIWKSDAGEWAFGYGTWLAGHLALETLVTGFTYREEAINAAKTHCYEVAEESSVDQGGEV